MIVEDQSEVIAFLRRPDIWQGAGPVEVMETHISVVFLAGDRAYKLKRAVSLPYADFSTPRLRAQTCEKEVRLNGPAAPGLYLGVRRITREPDGSLCLDGQGELVDALVEMVRFPQACLFDQLAISGGLTPALLGALAVKIVRFHEHSPQVHEEGGAENLAGVLAINEAGFATSSVFGSDETARFCGAFRLALASHSERLDQRARRGRIRRAHGDLHLRNICLFGGEPVLFDCIEFNDQIATVDVLYDLAFLLMDLWHRGLPGAANFMLNRYLDLSDDEDGFALLPFLMAVRAAVRAHVTATQAGEPGSALAAEARAYFDLAQSLLVPAQPRLIAIGGFSGSGTSTLADALAPHVGAPPGARVLESDRIRKAMFGIPPEQRLPAEAYRAEVSEAVYAELFRRAGALSADGACVVADAVFDRPPDRHDIGATAVASGTPFSGFWLEADPALLRNRVGARRGGG